VKNGSQELNEETQIKFGKMDNKKELIERVLLLMKYNNEMTLTENIEIISEEPIKNLSDYKTGNDYCNRGTVKEFQWVPDSLNGNDTFQGNKGYCRLSDSKQKNLSQSLGTGAGGFWDIPTFKVKTQDEWYAVFAVWLSQMVEEWKYTTLYLNKSDYEGGCQKNKLCGA
jgi:hypothetical protein